MICSNGRCKRSAKSGRKRCQRCTDSALRSQEKRCEIRSMAGLCIYCDRPVGPSSKIHCEKHHLIRQKQRKRHYEASKKAGKCWTCHKKSTQNKTICDRCLKNKLAQGRKKKFELSDAEYEKLISSQGKNCAVCLKPPPSGKPFLMWDHDHKTGRLRGFLCSVCNLAVGLAEDSPSILKRMARYLSSGRVVKK